MFAVLVTTSVHALLFLIVPFLFVFGLILLELWFFFYQFFFEFTPQVYLTADADDILDELDPSNIYIIGGIVDRNRFKVG